MPLCELLSFCKKHSKIVCYGAGKYGDVVYEYLLHRNVQISFFLVTNNLNMASYKHGVPIFSISNSNINLKDCGIILSLKPSYQQEVQKILLRRPDVEAIYVPTTALLGKLANDQTFNERRWIDLMMQSVDTIFPEEWKKKREYIKQHYDAISIHYMDMMNLGGFGLWIYYYQQRQAVSDRKYWLFYPVTPSKFGNGSSNINDHLAEMMVTDGAEVISSRNIAFWRNVLQKDDINIEWDDGFQLWGWNQTLDDFAHSQAYAKAERYIGFSEQEESNGQLGLRAMGIAGAYICISARDANYYAQVLKRANDETKMGLYRNSHMSTRKLAVDYLRNEGLQSVHMGAKVEKVFSWRGMIDYANQFRSEFMDIYLAAHCEFFVSDLCGIQVLAMLFSKPMVILNAALLTTRCDNIPVFRRETDIAILKKMWDPHRNKYLSIREMLDIEVNGTQYDKNITMNTFRLYNEKGIIPVENTAEEIMAVVKEMHDRQNGSIVYTAEEENLQEKYRSVVDSFPLKTNILSQWRLGTDFLRNNSWLLE